MKPAPPTRISDWGWALFRSHFTLGPRRLLGDTFLVIGEKSCQWVFQVSGPGGKAVVRLHMCAGKKALCCAGWGAAKMSLLSSLAALAHKRAPQHLGWLQPDRAAHEEPGGAHCVCTRLAHGPRFRCLHSLLETSLRHQKRSETSAHS